MGGQLAEHEDQIQAEDRVPRQHRALGERTEGEEDDEDVKRWRATVLATLRAR